MNMHEYRARPAMKGQEPSHSKTPPNHDISGTYRSVVLPRFLGSILASPGSAAASRASGDLTYDARSSNKQQNFETSVAEKKEMPILRVLLNE